MMIALIDDGDAHRSAREFLSGGQPTEAGPDDDDMVQVHTSRSLAQTSPPNPRDCLSKSRSPYTGPVTRLFVISILCLSSVSAAMAGAQAPAQPVAIVLSPCRVPGRTGTVPLFRGPAAAAVQSTVDDAFFKTDEVQPCPCQ